MARPHTWQLGATVGRPSQMLSLPRFGTAQFAQTLAFTWSVMTTMRGAAKPIKPEKIFH